MKEKIYGNKVEILGSQELNTFFHENYETT
jgi:hypothetical protein